MHGLHVIAGAIIMLIVAQTAKKNLELHRVELIGIYWHFVDIVWIFLFPPALHREVEKRKKHVGKR